ncbi:alpha/beta fold hydrolase [Candidatus Bathyarchaeota archaeon]|nr:MAG: alpha/beta fold hydrolase [Candidatus Bathyarchaeota archaeon]
MSILVENISFESEGYRLLGRIYRPRAEGRFPAVVLCHGYPGDNKNMDLAEELAFNNVVSLVFYYRGAWGSEGTFSLRGLDPSTRDAIKFLASQPFVDPERLGLIGYSMGAVPTAKRLSEDPRLKVGVFISPAADLRPLASERVLETIVPVFLNMGKGKLRGLSADLLRSELPWVLANLNPVEVIRDVRVPIMVVAGSKDNLTPPETCRALYEAVSGPKKWILIEGADHDYMEHRIPLINSVLQWLKDHL